MDLINKSLLNYFGIDKLGFYKSKSWIEFRDDIINGVLTNQMVVVPGDVGAGKSVLFQAAVDEMPTVKFIYVRNFYKERCTISSVLNAIIFDLQNAEGYFENPKKDLEARSRQITRLIGTTVTDTDKPFSVSIVIEEAHRLHKNTLRALKELREAKFAGICPLFSVVLIGHPELSELVRARKEVLWRALAIELDESEGWMILNDRVEFIMKVFGGAVTREAARTIATVCKTPLEIMKYVYDRMKDARKAGYKVIDSDIVKPTLNELFIASNLTYDAIAKEANLAKSTVYAAVNDKSYRDAIKITAIEKAIKNLVKEKSLLKRSA